MLSIFELQESVNVCFICHDETGTVVDKKEASVNITCEESYWKRFKKGYYDKKYGKGWWHKHHHKYEKKNKCKEGDYDKYAIRMTVSSCDSECTLLQNVYFLQIVEFNYKIIIEL